MYEKIGIFAGKTIKEVKGVKLNNGNRTIEYVYGKQGNNA